MRWIRRMRRRAQCRKRYGDNCPHIENHSNQPRTWVPLTRLDNGRAQHAALPDWHADADSGRGLGARADRVAPVSFVPESRAESIPAFPQWVAKPDAANRGAAARSQQSTN